MIDYIALSGVSLLAVVGFAVVFLPGLSHHMREVLLAVSAFCLVNAVLRALLIVSLLSDVDGRRIAGLSAVVFGMIAVHSLVNVHNENRLRRAESKIDSEGGQT